MSRRGDYSSRFQFLRGQYVTLALSDEVDVYGTVPGAVEDVVVLELA